jgi:hypothetical protein
MKTLALFLLLLCPTAFANELITLQGGQSIRLVLEGNRPVQVACIGNGGQDRFHCSLKFIRNNNCVMGNCHQYCVVYTESQQVVECVESDDRGSEFFREKARARMRLLREDGICR